MFWRRQWETCLHIHQHDQAFTMSHLGKRYHKEAIGHHWSSIKIHEARPLPWRLKLQDKKTSWHDSFESYSLISYISTKRFKNNLVEPDKIYSIRCCERTWSFYNMLKANSLVHQNNPKSTSERHPSPAKIEAGEASGHLHNMISANQTIRRRKSWAGPPMRKLKREPKLLPKAFKIK